MIVAPYVLRNTERIIGDGKEACTIASTNFSEQDIFWTKNQIYRKSVYEAYQICRSKHHGNTTKNIDPRIFCHINIT